MKRKLFILTHGCQMNEYDSTSMANVLNASHQMELTKNPEEDYRCLFLNCLLTHMYSLHKQILACIVYAFDRRQLMMSLAGKTLMEHVGNTG